MILGFTLQPVNIIMGAMFLALIVVFQMLVGLRVIHFKGRTHMKVHKWGAWALVAFATVHGSLALVYLLGWNVLS